jgi:hypothetical protein
MNHNTVKSNSIKNLKKNLDNIINSTKNYAAGVAISMLGVGTVAAQEITSRDTLNTNTQNVAQSRFTATPPYTVVKPGERYEFNDNREPHGDTYFLIRTDYEQFMKDLGDGKISVHPTHGAEFYSLLEGVKQSSIYDKIGEFNPRDGEDISKAISLHLGNVERVRNGNNVAFIDGIWNERETEEIAKLLKNKGYDKMWAIVLRQSEGYSETEQKYSRHNDLSLVLIDTKNYQNTNRPITAREERTRDARPGDTLYISPGVFAFYAGLGGDFVKDINRTIPQANLGIEIGRFGLGINGGYNEYSNNIHQEFINAQGNGRTDIHQNVNNRVIQYGGQVSFDVTKWLALNLGLQNNIIKSDTTGTVEQTNINPFTGEERYIKLDMDPTHSSRNNWTINPGVEFKINRFGIYGGPNIDPHQKKIVGGHAGIRTHFGSKYRRR